MDAEISDVKMLPAGDFDKLDKKQKEEFHALQEEMIALLITKSNHFKLLHPGLRIEWRFQAEIYRSVVNSPGSFKYSDRVY